MPRKKENKELFNNKPAPKDWKNFPDQFYYKTDKILVFQKDLDSPLIVTVNYVKLSEDCQKIIEWVKDNDRSN